MPVCWYYLQGICRYGDRCRNSHSRDGDAHSDRGDRRVDDYHWSRSSRSPQQPLVRASRFDFSPTREQMVRQEERYKSQEYRYPSYGDAGRRHIDQQDLSRGNRYRHGDSQDTYQDSIRGSQDRYQGSQDRYQGSQDRHQRSQDRYQGSQDRYQGSQDRYQRSQDRYHGSQDRYHESQDRDQGNRDRYQGNLDRYQGNHDRHLGRPNMHWEDKSHESERIAKAAAAFDFNKALEESRKLNEDRRIEKAAAAFDFNKALEESRNMDNNRDASEDQRRIAKAAAAFDFIKALDESRKLDVDRDASEDLSNITLSVVRDMKIWKTSGQWPFSSYGPYTDSLSLPGFVDVSMEELHWGCYQAREAGTTAAYNEQINQVVQAIEENIDQLVVMSPTAKQVLVDLQIEHAKRRFASASSGIAAMASSSNSGLPPMQPAAQPTAQSIHLAQPSASYVYSQVEDLTEEEKQQFLAENFTLGRMPEQPPPKEYC